MIIHKQIVYWSLRKFPFDHNQDYISVILYRSVIDRSRGTSSNSSQICDNKLCSEKKTNRYIVGQIVCTRIPMHADFLI